MNILENLAFGNERPSVCPIQRTDKINYFAIGLLHNQILKKHTANVPSLRFSKVNLNFLSMERLCTSKNLTRMIFL